ncbi:peptidoglycan-binding domain-containing protein [Aliiruegeria lutimaris]|uniref:Putative peptidoglycan binding domain-containing protein n=1 Tax=Aliiruegeria lutimaris TaxID=571298 RepID=A0A1G8T2F2_9RHOB|nr:peptidoglycan-binding domain-containing protein [Aliiruegeria lutimaris]SDJ35636.1 Putative peptidoglycan binding domain-containing protein [Aliiruegeria lutimaris]
MHRSILTSAIVMVALALNPVSRANAGSGDAVAGAIIGGIIGSAIASQPRQKTYTKRTYTKKSTVSSAQRAENRSVQHALNYFDFNAGTPDGVMGRNSRSAVYAYQAQLGYPATGQLTTYEKDFLLTSHNRALAGGPATSQMIAANPMGTRGLLLTYRDQAAGIMTAQPGTVSAPPPVATVVAAPPAEPQATGPAAVTAGVAGAVAGAANTQLAAAASKAPQMPSFFGGVGQR